MFKNIEMGFESSILGIDGFSYVLGLDGSCFFGVGGFFS